MKKQLTRRVSAALAAAVALTVVPAYTELQPAKAAPGSDTRSVPMRWCVVGRFDDTNGNGVLDPGETRHTEGAQAYAEPGVLGEATTDDVLWRRHERATEAVFLPLANVTLRSAVLQDAVLFNPDLNFPVILDPVPPGSTPYAGDEYGDITWPEGVPDPASEYVQVVHNCEAAWDHMATLDANFSADSGIVAVNIRQFRRASNGEGLPYGRGGPGTGNDNIRHVVISDRAYSYEGSPYNAVPNMPGYTWNKDPGELMLAHEVAHVLGLGHVACRQPQDNANRPNLMWNSLLDQNNDGVSDNGQLVDSIQQVPIGQACTNAAVFQTVDQRTSAWEAAGQIPGCKVINRLNPDGTQPDCTSRSDIATDTLGDARVRGLDMALLRVLNTPDGRTRFVHQLADVIRLNELKRSDGFEYVAFADLDNNPATGGAPRDLGFDTNFVGAELVTRVRVTAPATVPTAGAGVVLPVVTDRNVWRFEAGGFVNRDADLSVQGGLVPHFIDGFGTGARGPAGQQLTAGPNPDIHMRDSVFIEMSAALRGPAAPRVRVGAQTRTSPSLQLGSSQVFDVLEPGDQGALINLTSPRFPVAFVSPAFALPGQLVTVTVTGLLPNRGAHVILGSDLVAHGMADATGTARISFVIPLNTPFGPRLVTTGSDGTALTGETIVTVGASPFPGTGPGTPIPPPGGPGTPSAPGCANNNSGLSVLQLCGLTAILSGVNTGNNQQTAGPAGPPAPAPAGPAPAPAGPAPAPAGPAPAGPAAGCSNSNSMLGVLQLCGLSAILSGVNTGTNTQSTP